ncbi:MAG: hypothetical protein LBT79_06965, partial [Elusimicrobiota bacterium]|nr:hypothetical protein [Elusimicrobiota bacterium]
MLKIFKILFIILCVFIFVVKMDAASVSNWAEFQSIYESTAASNIDLSADISFGSDLTTLGHNIEINGNSHYMLGTSFFAGSSFKGFSLNSKSMILRDILLLGFHRYYFGAV